MWIEMHCNGLRHIINCNDEIKSCLIPINHTLGYFNILGGAANPFYCRYSNVNAVVWHFSDSPIFNITWCKNKLDILSLKNHLIF